MSEPADRYVDLWAELDRIMDEPGFTEEAGLAEAVRDRMDSLWRVMSSVERLASSERITALSRKKP
jgi:hypothetical protein